MKFLANSSVLSILLGLSVSVFAHEGTEHYGHHLMWQGYGMMMGPIMMILFIAVIIGVGALIFRWLGGYGVGSGTNSKKDPVDTLKMRLAQGEINKDEYEERLRLVQNDK